MATWYFKNVSGASTNWTNTNLWWSNANGTGSHPSSAPWTTSATAGDNVAPATGFSGGINLDVDLGSSSGAFTITGTCSTPIVCIGFHRHIYSGNYTQTISNPYRTFDVHISGGTFGGAVSGMFLQSISISGGTFNGSVQYASITNGTFNAAVLNATGITGGNFTGSVDSYNGGISAGTFNAAVTIENANVTGGTFNSSIVGSYNIGIVNGTFNGAVSNFSYISGGNFTNATVSNVNSITGGTHPTNYTGIWVNLYYNNGALATGFYGNRYYINGQYVSSLDSFGNGFYNSLLYIGGTSTGYAQSSVYVFNNANSTNDFTDLANYTLNGSVPTNLPSSSDIVYATIDQGLAPPWTLQGNLTASKIYININSSAYSVNGGTVVGDVYAIGYTPLEYFSITGHLYVLQQATGWNCTATTGITYNGFSGPGTTEDNGGIYVNGEFVAYSGGWQGQYYIGGSSSSCAGFIVDKDYSNGKYYFWDCQAISPEINSTSTFAVYADGLSFVFKNGVQTNATGVFYTYIEYGSYFDNLFINGNIASGGYNGYYYTATSDNPDTSFTGTAPDYYKDPTGVTQYCFVNGYSRSVDALGYCNGDAVQDCGGNYYSPSNEDGNTHTDPNGTTCNPNSSDCAGYCCGSSSIDLFGACYGSNGGGNGNTFGGCFDPAACGNGEAHNYGGYYVCMYDNGCGCGNCCLTDCRGNILGYPYDECFYSTSDRNNRGCDSSMLDALGYCCGDAIQVESNGYYDWCSPSGEDYSFGGGWTCHTDPNGNVCQSNSLDGISYCHGTCNDYSACGEDEYGCLYPDNCGNCNGGYGGCTDGSACNYDSCANYGDGSCQYDYGCGCGQNPPDNCGVCGGGCMDVCGGCGYDCGGVYDGLGICNGTCNDSSACGEDSYGCMYLDPVSGNCQPQNDCCPSGYGACGGGFGCGGGSYGAYFNCLDLLYQCYSTNPNGGCWTTVDALGYCNGDATQDCAGNWYSPSNEDGNTHTDPNGHLCNSNSVDALGYCCGDAIPTSYGDYCAPRAGYDLPSYGGSNACYTDVNNNMCQDQHQDAFGYCFGDATQDCAGNYYSLSNENGNTYTDPNGHLCNSVSVDCAGYCCGDAQIDGTGTCWSSSGETSSNLPCNDPSACGNASSSYGGYDCCYDYGFGCCGGPTLCEGDSMPWDGGAYYRDWYQDPNGNYCNSNGSYFNYPTSDALGYCCGDAIQDYAGNWYSPSNEDGNTATDFYGTKCNASSINQCDVCDYALIQGCANYYSLTGQLAGNCYGVYSYTDPNGTICEESDHDALGYCCGTCSDSSACGEDSSGCLYTDYGCGCGNPPPIDNCYNCDGSCGGINNCSDNGCGCGQPAPIDYCHDCYGNCTCTDCGNGCGTEGDACGNCVTIGTGCYSGCDNCGNCNGGYGGCTDGSACNYDSCANYNDGSCQYDYGCGCGNPAPDCSGDCGGTHVTDACGNCVQTPAILPLSSQVLNGVVFGCGENQTGTLKNVPGFNIGSLLRLPINI